jgi:hypothetical protein
MPLGQEAQTSRVPSQQLAWQKGALQPYWINTSNNDLRKKTKSAIIPDYTNPIIIIKNELDQYFEGKLKEFKTPLFLYLIDIVGTITVYLPQMHPYEN